MKSEELEQQTVYIVDDDPAICDGLSNLLESMGYTSRCFHSAEEFRSAWQQEFTGCLLLDVRLPGITGVQFQEELQNSGLRIPVIIMTAHGDVPMVRKVLKAGAVEFLAKPFQQDELLESVGRAFDIDRAQRTEERELKIIRTRLDSLTEREVEVLVRVTAGLMNKEIAGELGLSEVTVKLHRRHVMEKMEADSLPDLVRMYERLKGAPAFGLQTYRQI